MAQLRDIKDRIISVKKTKKITQAMKMVAAAKFKRATEAAFEAKPYITALDSILRSLQNRLEPDFIPKLMQDNTCQRQAVILITGDRGLCGGFNNNIMKFTQNFLNEQRDKEIELHLFGNKGNLFFKNKDYEIKSIHPHFLKDLSKEKVTDAITPLIEEFLNGNLGKVWLFYNEFASALSTNLIKKQLFPVQINPEENTENKENETPLSDYIYQPSKAEVLRNIISDYINTFVYKAFLESHAAEEGARMTAMDSATDNATDMISDLTLLYNRTRQAKITSELSEIVSGADALVH